MATNISVVTQVTGQAWIRDADGTLTPIHQGMQIPADANIVTAEGASVQLQANGVPPVTIGEGRDMQLSAEVVQADIDPYIEAAAPIDPEAARVLAALDAGDDPFDELDATAAVLQASGDAGGSSFTRLMSIVETTNPLGLEYPRPSFPGVEDVRFGDAGAGGGADDTELPAAPTLLIPDFNGIEAGQHTIAENAVTPATGTFTITAAAGLTALSINGEPVSLQVLQSLDVTDPDTAIEIETDRGTLTLGGYDATSGFINISYTYKVNGPQDHSSVEDDILADDIEIIVTDTLGRQVTGTLGISITDTDPVAEDDWGGVVVEDAEVSSIDGNVLENDDVFDQSDDQPATVEWNSEANQEILEYLGQYGDIALNPDGSWKFTLNNKLPAVQELTEGQTITVQLQYVALDNDGDQSDPATLTFQIKGTDDSATVTIGTAEGAVKGEAAIVKEADLRDSDTASTTGEFKVEATDGIVSITINGTMLNVDSDGELVDGNGDPLDPAEGIKVDKGTLFITGFDLDADGKAATVTYEYALDGNQDHRWPGTDSVFDRIKVSVEGLGGTTDTGSLVVRIVDDVPTADNFNAGWLREDGSTSTIKGNVLKDGETTFGADGRADQDSFVWNDTATVATLTKADGTTSITVDLSEYGTLVQGKKGFWKFELNNELAATQALNKGDKIEVALRYTIKDGDGDRDSGNVTFVIKGADDSADVIIEPVAGGGKAAAIVHEKGLIDGDEHIAKGSFTVEATDGIVAITINGTVFNVVGSDLIAADGGLVDLEQDGITVGKGTLFITGFDLANDGKSANVDYTYELDGAQHHHGRVFDDIEIGVKGLGGTDDTGNLIVRILDDTPTAVDIVGGVLTEGDDKHVLKGDVLEEEGVSFGADGEARYKPFEWDGVTAKLNNGEDVNLSDYGWLKQNPDGTWKFILNNKAAKTIALTEDDKIVVTLNYTIKDSDHDKAQGKVTFDIIGTNSVPVVENAKAWVRESVLVDHESDGNTFKGQLSIQDDDLSKIKIELDLPSGDELTSGGKAITWSYDTSSQDSNNVILGKAGDDTIIKITIDNDGSYKVTLLGPVDHPHPDTDDNHKRLAFEVPVIVKDGDHEVPTTLTVVVKDGEPSVVEETDTKVSVDNAPDAQAIGELGIDVGTDVDNAHARITSEDGESLDGEPVTAQVEIDGQMQTVTLKSGGSELEYVSHTDGSVTAVKVDDRDGAPVFTITPDVTAGTYTVNMHGIIDPIGGEVSTEDVFVGFSESGDGVGVNVGDAPFTLTLSATGPSSSPSTDGTYLGVARGGNGNTKISSNETLTFTFDATQNGVPITKVVFGTHNMGTGKATVKTDTNNSVVTGGVLTENIVVENPDGITFITLGSEGHGNGEPHGYSITTVQVFYETGSSVTIPVSEFTLDLGVVVTDGDGDTANNGLQITLEPTSAPVANDSEIKGKEDEALPIEWSAFNIEGGTADGDLAVIITGLPKDGELQYKDAQGDWVPVTIDQVISKEDIDSKMLRFVPDENESGADGYANVDTNLVPDAGEGTGNLKSDYATFTFKPSDGVSEGAEAIVTIDILPVADKPDLAIELSREFIPAGEGDGTDSKIIQVNGGSEESNGFDVVDGKIVAIGSNVLIWYTDGKYVENGETKHVVDLSADQIALIKQNGAQDHQFRKYDSGNAGDQNNKDVTELFLLGQKPGAATWRVENGKDTFEKWTNLTGVTGQSDGAQPDYIITLDGAVLPTGGVPHPENNQINHIDSVRVGDLNGNQLAGVISIDPETGEVRGHGTQDGTVPDTSVSEPVYVYTVDVTAAVTDTDSEYLGFVVLNGIPDDAQNVSAAGDDKPYQITKGDNGWILTWGDDARMANAKDINAQITFTMPADAGMVTGIDAEVVAHEHVGDSTASSIAHTEIDAVFAQITVDKSAISEGDELNYTVQLVDHNGQPVTVPQNESITITLGWSGAAANDDDTTGRPDTVTITGGDSKAAFTVTTVDDDVVESSEDLIATITGVESSGTVFKDGIIIKDPSVTSTIHDDDLEVNVLSPEIGNIGLTISTWSYTSDAESGSDAHKINQILDALKAGPQGVTNGHGAKSDSLETLVKKLQAYDANGTFEENGGQRFHGYGGETGAQHVQQLIARNHGETDTNKQQNVAENTAVHAHGIIYLQKGETYTVKAYGDDSLRVVLGDRDNGGKEVDLRWGTHNSTSREFIFTPQESGLYTFDMYMHNQDNAGMYDVSIWNNADAHTAIPFFPDVESARAQLQAQNEGFTLGSLIGDELHGHHRVYGFNEGEKGKPIALTQVMQDGLSDDVTLTIEGIPAGATLTDGTHFFTAGADNTTADISGWNTTKLSLTSDQTGTFTLTVVAQEPGQEGFDRTHEFDVRIDDTTVAPAGLFSAMAADSADVHTLLDDSPEILMGTSGDDVIAGTDSDDIIIGGAGNDILTGGAGNDLFIWNAGDEGGTGAAAARDVVTDFGNEGTDTLDIRGLLSNAGDGDLGSYFEVREGTGDDGGKTVIEISTQGNSQVDQKIVLDNISFSEEIATKITNSLIADGKLSSGDLS